MNKIKTNGMSLSDAIVLFCSLQKSQKNLLNKLIFVWKIGIKKNSCRLCKIQKISKVNFK
jgi:hypothetical protein